MAALLSPNSAEGCPGKYWEPVRVGRVFFRERALRAKDVTSGVGCNAPPFGPAARVTHPSFGAIGGEFDGVKFGVS